MMTEEHRFKDRFEREYGAKSILHREELIRQEKEAIEGNDQSLLAEIREDLRLLACCDARIYILGQQCETMDGLYSQMVDMVEERERRKIDFGEKWMENDYITMINEFLDGIDIINNEIANILNPQCHPDMIFDPVTMTSGMEIHSITKRSIDDPTISETISYDPNG